MYADYFNLKIVLKPFRAESRAVTTSATAVTSTATSTTTATTTTTATVTGDVNLSAHTHTIGDHNHDMSADIGVGDFGDPVYYRPAYPGLFTPGGGTLFGGATTSNGGATTSSSGGGGTFNASIPSLSVNPATVNIPALSVSIPSQTATIDYGIFEDTANPPTGIKLYIDGVDYSSQVSIPNGVGTSPSGSTSSFDLMLSAHNLGQFSNLFKFGYHEVKLTCTGGRAWGQLYFNWQLYLSAK